MCISRRHTLQVGAHIIFLIQSELYEVQKNIRTIIYIRLELVLSIFVLEQTASLVVLDKLGVLESSKIKSWELVVF
jgi:hypothetical protein